MDQVNELGQRSARLLGQARRLMERAQTLLAQLQAFPSELEQLHAELAAHDQHLQAMLGRGPAPTPPSAYIEPQSALFPWEVSEREVEPSSQPERRASVRRAGNLLAVVIRRATDHESIGWVLDRSLGGLGLLTAQAAETGTFLHVRAANASIDAWIPVEVRACQPLGSSWRLSCRFVGQPSWEQVQTFG